jgi:hypothetical protein
MRRLFISLGSLLFICAVSISAAQALGRSQVSESVQKLHLTDCELPCFMGITLGKTTLEQAKQILMAIPSASIAAIKPETDDDRASIVVKVVKDTYTIIYFHKSIAESIYIDGEFSSDMPSLGDAMPIYGTPKCGIVSPAAGNLLNTIYVPDEAHGVGASFFSWSLMTWNSKIVKLSIWRITPDDPSTRCESCFYWRGPQNPYGESGGQCGEL